MPSSTVASPSLSGWKEHRAARFRLWLPKSYIAGDPVANNEILVEQLRAMGPAFGEMADLLEQNPSASSFLAIDSHLGASGGITSLRVAEEQVGSTTSVDMYMDAVTARFPDSMKVIARDVVTLPSGRATRLQFRVQVNGMTAEQVDYFIKSGDTIYSLAYTTGQDEISRRFSSFEKSASTFLASQ